jgi:hypothetical protein
MIDTLAPVFSYVPDSLFLQCASGVPPASIDSVIVADNCLSDVTVMVSDSVMNDTLCPNQFTLLRTWTATDTCGNTSMAAQFISVFDSLSPILYGVPADTGVCCPDSIPLPANVTAFDNCDGALPVTLTEVISDSTGPNYFTLTRYWTAQDTCFNMVIDSMIIEVNDTLYPPGGGMTGILYSENIVRYFNVSPNPFIDATNIEFSLSQDANVSLELYNFIGIQQKRIFNGNISAGKKVSLNLAANESMPPGMYLLVLKTPLGIKTKRILVNK